jgi:hypothetical protein
MALPCSMYTYEHQPLSLVKFELLQLHVDPGATPVGVLERSNQSQTPNTPTTPN